MKVYVCTDHPGHYGIPVGSVIVARDEGEARRLLAAELAARGLETGEAASWTLDELPLTRPLALVLSDGDY